MRLGERRRRRSGKKPHPQAVVLRRAPRRSLPGW
jgi:hypothetical protein